MSTFKWSGPVRPKRSEANRTCAELETVGTVDPLDTIFERCYSRAALVRDLISFLVSRSPSVLRGVSLSLSLLISHRERDAANDSRM